MDFSVEMETGTGKTYVYLRTLYELNVRYGFTKFVIVVPSVAIREGVLSSLRLTREHSGALRQSAGGRLGLRLGAGIAAAPVCLLNQMQVLVINIDAFNKKDIDGDSTSRSRFHKLPERADRIYLNRLLTRS